MAGRHSEDELIARIFAPFAGPAALGLADDAALLEASSEPLVVAVDTLVAGVHFFPDDPPGSIARKALRVNLSDLAAKGAAPVGFLLALSLPGDWTNDWLEAFAAGLAEDARAYRAPLIGGDTTRTPGPLVISITALGRTPRFVPRTGAKPGEALYVSGTIGDAALGLALRRDPALAARLSPQAREHLFDRYLLPRPRLDLIDALRASASAAMDVSDGLAGDLAKLCRASGVSAIVYLAAVPLSSAAREAIFLEPALFETVMTGGDDYEILLTSEATPDPAQIGVIISGGANVAVSVGRGGTASRGIVRIGEIVAGNEPPIFRGDDGRRRIFETMSFQHF
jgi:thiamine-monophosphate kinase